MWRLFSYAGTGNLGDAIQTLALRRLLAGPVEFEERDGSTPGGGALLANGYLAHPLPPRLDFSLRFP